MKALAVVHTLVMTCLMPSVVSAQDTTSLVTVSEPEYVASRSAVRVVVSNHASQPVTAWEVGIRVIYGDGVERGHRRAREGYAVLAGLSDSRDRLISPGGTAETWFYLPRAKTMPIMSLRSNVFWAIFADMSGIGDPKGLDYAFEQRERELKAWNAVAAAMRLAATGPNHSEGLKNALTWLNAPAQEDFDHAIKRIMRQNIQRVLQQPPDKHEFFVSYWSAHASRFAKATADHRRVRPQPQQ